VDRLEKLLEGDPGDVLVEYIQSSGPITAGDIVQASVIEDAFSVIGQLIQTGELIKLGRAEITPKSYIVTKARWEETGTQSQKILSAYHLKYPLRAGMPVQEFKTKMGLDPKWAMPWIESAREYSWLEYSQTAVRAFKHSPALTSQQDTAAKKLLVEMEANPYSTPSKKEILGDLGEELLDYLIGTGELIQVSDDVIFSMSTYQISVERIKNVLQDKGTISVAEVRDMFNTTRKYALALMEYLDEAGVTVREGDVRKLLH
jgi:selenocysteine-specific elongation factor